MKSKYFKLHEFLPKELYEKYGERGWRYVDERLIITMDILKEHFNLGTIQINNYYFGGDREHSSIRTPSSPYYSVGSMHTYARAIDFVCSDYSAQEVRNYIIGHPHVFKYVRGLELGVSWVHLDIRNEDELVLFRVPKG